MDRTGPTYKAALENLGLKKSIVGNKTLLFNPVCLRNDIVIGGAGNILFEPKNKNTIINMELSGQPFSETCNVVFMCVD